MTRSRRSTTRSLAVLAAAVVGLPFLSAAQPAAPAPAPLLPQQSVAVNPLAIPFGLFSGEYEAALPTPGFTLGIGGSYYADNGDRDSWIEAKALYYPSETPFRGFSVGLSAGIQSARNSPNCGGFLDSCSNSQAAATRRSQTAPTLGVIVSYDWLIGRQERFRIGLGAGAKRVLKDVGSNDPLEQVYPDGRFVIGLVF